MVNVSFSHYCIEMYSLRIFIKYVFNYDLIRYDFYVCFHL